MAANEKRSAILQYNSEVKLANAITNLEKRKIVEENKKKAASAKSAAKRRHNNNEVRKAKYKSDRNSLGNNGTDEFVAVTSETSEGHTDSDINIDVKNFNEGYNNDSIFITCGCCGQELGYNEISKVHLDENDKNILKIQGEKWISFLKENNCDILFASMITENFTDGMLKNCDDCCT